MWSIRLSDELSMMSPEFPDYEFRKQSTELKSNSDFSLDLPESDRSVLVNLSDSKSVLSFYFSGIDVDLKGGFSLTQAFPGNTEFSLDT